MELQKHEIKKAQQMLKLIPNGISVCIEDLIEIYSQEPCNREVTGGD